MSNSSLRKSRKSESGLSENVSVNSDVADTSMRASFVNALGALYNYSPINPPPKKKHRKNPSADRDDKENVCREPEEKQVKQEDTPTVDDDDLEGSDDRQASTSREASVTWKEIDGKIKGTSLDATERDLIEYNSMFIYPFPRSIYVDGKIMYGKGKKRPLLDLMEDGEIEVETGKGKGAKVYSITGILALNKHEVLVNWFGFKFPTWQPREDVKRKAAMREYERRQKVANDILRNLTNTEPNTIENYPNIVLKRFSDFGENVTSPGILYISGLLKRERQINDILDGCYPLMSDEVAPTLFFVDWTDFEYSSIPAFEYILDPVLSEPAKEVHEELEANTSSCSCIRCDIKESCCAHKSETKVAYVKKAALGSLLENDAEDEKGALEIAADCVDVYECGDNCACDRKRCRQRVVQKGRRGILVAFRHHEKGWTLRTGEALKGGAFVCEYTGLVLTNKEAFNRCDKTYHMDLKVKTKTQSSKGRTFVIDAKNMGNESRFIAHSCEPNIFTYRIHYDVSGHPKRHIGFFAIRDIEAGEELTFDYFSVVKDPKEFHKLTLTQGWTCKCGSEHCRETAYKKMINEE